MQPHAVHHVSLNVDDLDAARTFYIEVLGLTEIPRPDLGFPGAWLRVGAQEVHLLVGPPVEARGQHVALAVDDLDAALAELRTAGVAVRGPGEIPGVCRQAFCADPAGNTIELNQRL